MLIALVLLAAQANPAALVMKVAAPAPAPDAPAPHRSPYRLDPNIAGPADGKATALRETGGECAVVGARLCTRPPRALYSAGY